MSSQQHHETGRAGESSAESRSQGADYSAAPGATVTDEPSVPGGFSGRGPKGYERSGERIREDVCEGLTDDDQVDASEIEVDVEGAVVTLRGSVDDRSQKRRAEDIAEQVKGVRDVRNLLELPDAMVGDLSDQARRSSRDADADLGSFRDPSWAGQDLRGFEVEARDGKIGKVDDDSEVGSDHLIVDVGTWIFGRKVVLPVGLVEQIAFDHRRLLVSRSKDEIKHAPDFDENHADDPRYADELRAYYGGGAPEREGSLR